MISLLILVATTVAELPPPAPRLVDFEKDVRPILATSCLKCHGPDKQRGGLRLDVKASAFKGGDDETPAIVAGKGAESPLIQLVAGLDPERKMPPQGPSLTPEQVGILRAWIDQGATWPESASASPEDVAKSHWAFQPIRRPALPSVSSETQSHVRNPIDAFIGAKLEAQGLAMSPEADRRTLIRRLAFVLHGIPPTPEEIAAFVADGRPDAFERLVDRYLASPRYGERWGRHWLDIIAFGETHGFEVNTPRENAWPYRDYVIEAFNKDTPYPRFILEQLAGDQVGEDRATGFLVASAALLPGQIGRDEESRLRARQDELSDMVAGAGSAFLGLTLHCARCHDHKFDPILQSDFYAMQAVFAGTQHGERELHPADWAERQKRVPELRERVLAVQRRLLDFEPVAGLEPDPQGTPKRPSIDPRMNVERFSPVLAAKVRFTVHRTTYKNRFEPCVDELEVYTAGPDRRNVALAASGAKATASGTIPDSSIHRLEHINDGRFGNERSWISSELGKGWVTIELARPEVIDVVVWGRDRNQKYSDRLAEGYTLEVADPAGAWKVVATSEDREAIPDEGLAGRRGSATNQGTPSAALRSELAKLEAELRAVSTLPRVYGGRFVAAGPTYRLHRGEATQPRERVSPAAVTSIQPRLELPADAPEHERRLALARWLGAPANPLPARVIANRIWQNHFAEGLVRTPSDFGRNGVPPSHPELLDWLASELVAQGWSLKALHRAILTSATWRQSSRPRPEALAKDAASRLLWRFPPRRLEAEAIRDSMVAVAGTLDSRMGGPGFLGFAPNDNYVRVYDPKLEYGPADWRRMIYQTKVRMAQDSTFGAFDCPDAGQKQPQRARSTTPLQALNLFNSHFVLQQAGVFAERLRLEAGEDPRAQVRLAYQLAFGRSPTDDEARLCVGLVREAGVAGLGRVLFNANEFLFIP